MKKFSRLVNEGAWIVVGQGASMAGSILGVKFLTELMTPEDYGLLALALTIVTFVNQLLHGPLQNGSMRLYSSAKDNHDMGGFLGAVGTMFRRSSYYLIGCYLIAVISAFALADFGEWYLLSLIAVAFSLLVGANSTMAGVQNAARQRKVVAINQGIGSWSRILFAVILLKLLDGSASSALAGFALGLGLVLISQYYHYRRLVVAVSAPPVAPYAEEEWVRKIFSYSWPFAIWSIFFWAQQSSDRWALELFGSTEEVGSFSVIHQLGYMPLSVMSGMLFQLLAPILFQRAGDGSDHARLRAAIRVNRIVVLIVLLSTILTAAVAFFAHERILALFAAPAFGSTSHLLPWMIISGGIFAAGQICAIEQMSSMKSRALLMPRIVTSIVGVGLNFWLAFSLGMEGVVLASIVYSCMYMSWMLVLQRSDLGRYG